MKPESLSRSFARLKDAGVKIEKDMARISDIQALRDYVEEEQ